METVNINRSTNTEQGDSADRAGLPDWKAVQGSSQTRSSRGLDWRVALALILVPAAGAYYVGYGFLQYWNQASGATSGLDIWLAAILKVAIYLTPVALLGAAVVWAWNRARRSAIERLPNNVPVLIKAIEQPQWTVFSQQSMAAFYEVQGQWAEHSGLRSLNQLDLSNTHQKPQEQAALPAPAQLGLVPDSEWLGWIDNTPHLMIAGRTNAGKTTLATAVLGQRVRAGELVAFLDPHDQPGKWFGAQAIGGGRNYPAIFDALGSILREMDDRYNLYNQGQTAFPRLTVLIDEVPAVVQHDKLAWRYFASQLGSEARKVNMSVVLLTQSPLVRDIEISSVMRENFTRIALGDQAPELLTDERDTARRRELSELLRGQAHPAAMEYRGEVHLLDTTNVPGLARQGGRACLWLPPVHGVARITKESATRKALAALKSKGVTREQARQVYGLSFTNDVWGEV